MEQNIEKLEKNIDIKFKDKNLLKTAFIHRSYLNEHPEEPLPHNERLEFLGDAVLGMVISEYLYIHFPGHPEGDLTNFRSSLVNARILSQISASLKLGDYLFLSKGEEATGGRQRQYILANTFEALLGAIFLDLGLEAAKKFIFNQLLPPLAEILEKRLYRDFKSLLQEKSQEELATTPSYKVLKETGPDHAKLFLVGVYLGKKKLAQGAGSSKQSAEQEAAAAALENWGEKG
jgi:ribonuclease-3